MRGAWAPAPAPAGSSIDSAATCSMSLGVRSDMTDDRPHEPHVGEAAELEQDRFVGDTDLTRWHSRPGAAVASAGQRMGTRLGDRAALAVILLAGCAVIAVLAFG